MSSRLQVGGLALIIHSQFEENIGKVVKLIRHHGVIESNYGDIDHWILDSHGLKTNNTNSSGKCFHPTKYLMPLGDQQTQDELRKEQEELTCKN